MPKLDIYNMSKLGVNVDKAQPFLEDGELTKAQNAIRDGIGEDGGLRKRPGLVEFNGSAAAGSVIGGVGVPLSYEGTLSTATRTLYLGRWNSSTLLSLGWHTSTDAFATETLISSGTPANPVNPNNIIDQGGGLGGFTTTKSWARWACVLNNRLYYASDNYTRAVTAPTIRVFDGTFDEPLVRIPGVTTLSVLTMAALNGQIYLTTFDSGRSSTASLAGRVFSLTPDGVLTQIGAQFTSAGTVPFALAWAFGRLWVGTHAGTYAGHSTTIEIYWIRPGIDTAWTLDRTVAGTNMAVGAMASYNGALYAGYYNDAVTISLVEKRTALGVWSTSDSVSVGGGLVHGYCALGTFGTNLYALRFTETGSLIIRKFNGTSWSSVTVPTNSQSNIYTQFFTDNGIFYAFGSTANSLAMGMKTSDGTTWTDITQTGSSANAATSAFGIILT